MLSSSCCWPTAEPKCGAFSAARRFDGWLGVLRLPTLYCRTTLQRRLSNRCYVPPDDRFAPYAGVGVCRRSRRAATLPGPRRPRLRLPPPLELPFDGAGSWIHCGSSPLTVSFRFISRSICAVGRRSSRPQNDVAMPVAPARPVRPMRWT